MSSKINVGDGIPSFFIKDNEGYELTEEDLLGSPFVLYFYPKDNTPGCTLEACSFRDNMEQFDLHDILVIGVSPDGADSHNSFAQKHGINFTLLSDENLDLCRKFDVLREKIIDGKSILTVERTTFVVDSDGVIVWIERPVNVDGHVERVLEAIKSQVEND